MRPTPAMAAAETLFIHSWLFSAGVSGDDNVVNFCGYSGVLRLVLSRLSPCAFSYQEVRYRSLCFPCSVVSLYHGMSFVTMAVIVGAVLATIAFVVTLLR